MKLLLDTHAFLWWVDGTRPLGRRAATAVADPDNQIFVSMASCWELAIKRSLGKLRVARDLDRFITDELTSNGFDLLDVQLAHVVRVVDLPFRHRDPFDRLLVAQALEEELSIVSNDRIFPQYGVRRVW